MDSTSIAEPPLFSIICVYNRWQAVEQWLLPSLEIQSATFELLLVDNSHAAFRSAAAALNHGAKKARGQWLMFVHQDVQLPMNELDWLDRAVAALRSIGDLGVAGLIGSTGDEHSSRAISFNSITQGLPPNAWTVQNTPIERPTAVQTLDELMLIVPRHVFEQLPFDESACPNWHLYGVDYALSVQRLGLRAYVLPLTAHHVSPGRVDANYYVSLKKLLPKHRAAHRWLYTGCGVWNTNAPVVVQKFRHKARAAWRMAKMKLASRWA